MQIRNSQRAWGAVQQGFHWFTALAVISQLIVGLIFANLPENDPRGGTLFGVHATLGLVIFFVMLARFAWRQANPVPGLPDTLKPYEKRIATVNHCEDARIRELAAILPTESCQVRRALHQHLTQGTVAPAFEAVANGAGVEVLRLAIAHSLSGQRVAGRYCKCRCYQKSHVDRPNDLRLAPVYSAAARVP